MIEKIERMERTEKTARFIELLEEVNIAMNKPSDMNERVIDLFKILIYTNIELLKQITYVVRLNYDRKKRGNEGENRAGFKPDERREKDDKQQNIHNNNIQARDTR